MPHDGPDLDTRQLVARAQAGDAPAIDELLRRHLPALRAFVRLRSDALLRQKESASDLVQSVCREVLANLDDFEYRSEGSFRAWLFAWALNKVRTRARYYRAQRRDPGRERRPRDASTGVNPLFESYATFLTPSRIAIGREDLARVESAFDLLPEDYQEVILLARVIGISQAEIGTRMQRSEPAVRQLLKRAIVRLATLIDRGEGSQPQAPSEEAARGSSDRPNRRS